jgi:acyl-CoA thioester hydrolase
MSPGARDEARPAEMLVQRRIEWPDTDASGHYHNTAAFRLLEVVETALLERLGILGEVYGRLPRVHISADFKGVLWFRDLVDVSLKVDEVGTSSVTYLWNIARDGEVCVEGRATAVLLDDDRQPIHWSERHRRVLLTAGPQAPELLVKGES